MMTGNGELRPLDFEGACPTGRPDPMPWGTLGFTPPEWRSGVKSREYEDLYALGAMLYLLLTGRRPESFPLPIKKLRRNVPQPACRLVAALLTADPKRQPSARAVAQRLLALAPDAR
jgi:serine/threonine protein kinase